MLYNPEPLSVFAPKSCIPSQAWKGHQTGTKIFTEKQERGCLVNKRMRFSSIWRHRGSSAHTTPWDGETGSHDLMGGNHWPMPLVFLIRKLPTKGLLPQHLATILLIRAGPGLPDLSHPQLSLTHPPCWSQAVPTQISRFLED